jgi:DNA polymerase I-like protein with 3'-5' exonuclease and polymerase domains
MNLVAFDVETWGKEPQFALQPFRLRSGDAWLTSYAFARETASGRRVAVGEHCIPEGGFADTHPLIKAKAMARTVERMRAFLVKATANNWTIVCWNAPFDVAWLIAMGLKAEVFACKWLDGMLLRRHLENWPTGHASAIKLGLKDTVATYMPEKAGYEEGIDFGAVDSTAMTGRLEYNKLDCEHTLDLATMFLARMPAKMRRLALIEARTIPLAAEAMVEGLTGDREAALDLSSDLNIKARVAYVTLKLQAPEIDTAVLASPVQLRKVIYGGWGLPVRRLTDKGAASTDRDALMDLAELEPRVGLLNTYREAINNNTKFAQGMIDTLLYNGDGQTRPQFRVFGTYTGRGTYSSKVGRGVEEQPSGCALHQWKRDPAFRKLIKAPPGYTLIELDFAGQEFRWMAVESRDHTMLDLCQPGEDAHAFMGAKIAGVSYAAMLQAIREGDPLKGKRQLGKVGNLSCQYRTGWLTLQRLSKREPYSLTLSDIEAQAIHASYRVSYPGVPKYWNRQQRLGREMGYVETLAGRRVQLGSEGWDDVGVKWKLESTAINFPIQGIGADQKYLALMILRDYLPKVDGRFYFELHDGIFFVVPDAYADRAVREARHLLSNLPYKQAWGLDLPVQFPVDAKMGPSWGELKEIKE